MKACIRSLVPLVALVLVVFPSAEGATVAGAGIEVGGEYVGGYAITWDGQTRAELVRLLPDQPLTFERGFVVPVEEGNPEVAMLAGQVRVLSRIRGDREVVMTTGELPLVRRGGEWFVEGGGLWRAIQADLRGVGGADGASATAPAEEWVGLFADTEEELRRCGWKAPDAAAIEVARSHVTHQLSGDVAGLEATYGERVQLMPGHEFLKERYGLGGDRATGMEVGREQLLEVRERMASERQPPPAEQVEEVVGGLEFAVVDAKEGDYAAEPGDPVGSPDGKLHFQVREGDRLVEVSPQESDDVLLIQLRLDGEVWRVVAEYLD